MEELNLDALRQEWQDAKDAEQEQPPVEDEAAVEDESVETDEDEVVNNELEDLVEDDEAEEEDVPTGDESTETEPNPEDVPEFDTHKQNQAFAKMRNELKEANKHKKMLEELADAQGVSVDEYMRAYEDHKLKQDAEKDGVPVEFLKEQRKLQEQVSNLTRDNKAREFNYKVEQLKNREGLTESDLKEFFGRASDAGIDLINTPNIDVVYSGLFYQDRLNKAIEKQEQARLKKKRDLNRAPKVTGGASTAPSDSASTEKNLQDAALAAIRAHSPYLFDE